MAKLKNLATCKPSEFLKQTVKIRRAVERWMTATDIDKIRKTLPELMPLSDDMGAEARAAAVAENRKRIASQGRENAMRIIDAILEDHPEETLEVLALVCFVDPAKVDDHPMEEYLEAIGELIGSEAVISFFTSVARLGATSISTR